MAEIIASDIIQNVTAILADTLSQRWPDDELMGYLNDAQLEVVNKRPDASVNSEPMSCALNTRQTIPAKGIRLIKVVRNTVSGLPITLTNPQLLDEQVPEWHSTTSPTARVEHYVFDDRDPKHFYLYPAPTAGHQVDVVYSVTPAIVNTINDVLSVDDIYKNALVDYVLYRAFMKDAENQANMARSAGHRDAFDKSIGYKTKADAAVSPNNG